MCGICGVYNADGSPADVSGEQDINHQVAAGGQSIGTREPWTGHVARRGSAAK